MRMGESFVTHCGQLAAVLCCAGAGHRQGRVHDACECWHALHRAVQGGGGSRHECAGKCWAVQYSRMQRNCFNVTYWVPQGCVFVGWSASAKLFGFLADGVLSMMALRAHIGRATGQRVAANSACQPSNFDKVTLATWCMPCRLEHPQHMPALHLLASLPHQAMGQATWLPVACGTPSWRSLGSMGWGRWALRCHAGAVELSAALVLQCMP
jgi:hypothetical protein